MGARTSASAPSCAYQTVAGASSTRARTRASGVTGTGRGGPEGAS
jgi:hypothetical protein